MAYTPKSEDQLAKEGLLENGTYDCEAIETSDKPSKKGSDMFTLKLNVYSADGKGNHIYDYMVMGNHFGERKLRHAAAAFGLIEVYEGGKLNHQDFLGRGGKVKVKIQEGNADYPLPKNVIEDYIARDEEGKADINQLLEGDKCPF